MNKCDENQLLENMSATQTQKQMGDFFSGGNSAKYAKTSNRVKLMVKNNQLMEMLSNGMQKFQTEWLQKPHLHWLRYDNAKKLMTCSICIQQKKTNAMTS